MTVALDTSLDAELLLEGRVYDLIRAVNKLRKDMGMELTDRIVLTVGEADREVVEQHRDWVARETLAVDIRVDSDLAIAKA